MEAKFFLGRKAFFGFNKKSSSAELDVIPDDHASDCNFEDNAEDESIQYEVCMANLDIKNLCL